MVNDRCGHFAVWPHDTASAAAAVDDVEIHDASVSCRMRGIVSINAVNVIQFGMNYKRQESVDMPNLRH
jgi:hypothetical protein